MCFEINQIITEILPSTKIFHKFSGNSEFCLTFFGGGIMDIEKIKNKSEEKIHVIKLFFQKIKLKKEKPKC